VDDRFVQLAEHGVATLADSAVPGKWIVDIFPWGEYILRSESSLDLVAHTIIRQ
jgi:hypothetical protein